MYMLEQGKGEGKLSTRLAFLMENIQIFECAVSEFRSIVVPDAVAELYFEAEKGNQNWSRIITRDNGIMRGAKSEILAA